jgi:ribosomal protein S18 acetylase RimI-like enzyme
MFKTPTIADIQDITTLIHEMNQTHDSYSGFMSRDRLSIDNEIRANIESKTIVIDQHHQGLISYYINEETKSIDIAGPYVKNFDLTLGTDLVQYLIDHYPDYQLNFFFDRQSMFYTSIMERLNASYQGNETILSLQKPNFKMIYHNLDIDLIKDYEKKHIQEMHDIIFPDVYLTSSELIKEEDNKSLYVLHDEGKPIGYALIKLMKDQAFLEIFAIEKTHRGQGLAKPFISTVIKQAFKHQNIQKVYLVVDDINEIAYRLYEKIGFMIQNQNVSYHIHHQV